jgi:uncharacterized protein (TIGR02594 family)
MQWNRVAVVATLAVSPIFVAAGNARGDQLAARGVDAAWIATQLNQPHFSGVQEQAAVSGGVDGGVYHAADVGASSLALAPSGGGASNVVSLAERYRGTNPTGRTTAWCAVFANMVLKRTGHPVTGSDAAQSFARYGRPAAGPAPGVIAVWPHHVGFVVGVEGPGRMRVVSGNHRHRVEESIYPTNGVMAYRRPT